MISGFWGHSDLHLPGKHTPSIFVHLILIHKKFAYYNVDQCSVNFALKLRSSTLIHEIFSPRNPESIWSPRWLSCPRWSHRMRARCAGSWPNWGKSIESTQAVIETPWSIWMMLKLEIGYGMIWLFWLMINIASVSNQHPFNALRVKNQTTHASTFLPGESFERCKQVFGDETDLAVLQEVM